MGLVAPKTRMNQRSGRAGLRFCSQNQTGAVPPLYMRRMCTHDGDARHRYRLHQCEDRGRRHSRRPRFVRGPPERLVLVLHARERRQASRMSSHPDAPPVLATAYRASRAAPPRPPANCWPRCSRPCPRAPSPPSGSPAPAAVWWAASWACPTRTSSRPSPAPSARSTPTSPPSSRWAARPPSSSGWRPIRPPAGWASPTTAPTATAPRAPARSWTSRPTACSTTSRTWATSSSAPARPPPSPGAARCSPSRT